jgi:hypothetical protein
MHVKNLTKITYLLARKFIKTAADISDPFKGRFEFVDAEEFGLLRESFIFPSQREQFWEEQTRYSFEPRERNAPAYRIYTLKSPVYSYIIPFYEGYTQRYFPPGGLNIPIREQGFGVFGYAENYPLDFPSLVYATKSATENRYNVGFAIDPSLIFGNARPEHIAPVLQEYMDSTRDAEKFIAYTTAAYGLLEQQEEGRDISGRLQEESPEVQFLMKNRGLLRFYNYFFDTDLIVKPFILSIFEARLADLPPEAAAAGYRLIRFLSDYYERISRKYFLDYHPDLPVILKLQIARTLTPRNRCLKAFDDSLWDLLREELGLPGIDRHLRTWGKETNNRLADFNTYWGSKSDYVFSHLVRANIDRSKKIVDYLTKYILSPDVPHPEAIKKLPQLSAEEESYISEFERRVGAKLNFLRSMMRYSLSISAEQYDRGKNIGLIENMAELYDVALKDPKGYERISDKMNAAFDIARVSRLVFGIQDYFLVRKDNLIQFSRRAPVLVQKGVLADLENIADIIYRSALIHNNALLSISRESSVILYGLSTTKNNRLRMDTKILPSDIAPYVVDFSLVEPRFENFKNLASTMLKVHSQKPGFNLLRLRRGR